MKDTEQVRNLGCLYDRFVCVSHYLSYLSRGGTQRLGSTSEHFRQKSGTCGDYCRIAAWQPDSSAEAMALHVILAFSHLRRTVELIRTMKYGAYSQHCPGTQGFNLSP